MLAANQAFADLTGHELGEIVGTVPPFPWWAGDEDVSVGFDPGSVITTCSMHGMTCRTNAHAGAGRRRERQ